MSWLRARPRVAVGLVCTALALLLGLAAFSRPRHIDDSLVASVKRGDLIVRLTETGILRPAQSLTYRSPLNGREAEVVFLAPEGTRVQEGDLLVRLEAAELEHELQLAIQGLRQAQVELEVAMAEREEAAADLEALVSGEGTVDVEQARLDLKLAEKKVEQLRQEYASSEPLLKKGFMTREELDRTGFELERAEAELQLARRRTEIFVERTYPRDTQRARLRVSQREAQLGYAQAKRLEAASRVEALKAAIEACSIYARRPGLVVYEDYLPAMPRRKIRVGDRVTPTQGLVTIPEVGRMLVETSVRESDLYRVRPRLDATISLDAFPALVLSGKVLSVGALARASIERPFEEKRFDVVVEIDSAGAELRPEMTARVDILVERRTNVLLVPLNGLFDREGTLVANVVGGWTIQQRPVDIGASNEMYAEVLSGLREGDRVSLVDRSAGADRGAIPSAPRPLTFEIP